jgi:hypothetical protein
LLYFRLCGKPSTPLPKNELLSERSVELGSNSKLGMTKAVEGNTNLPGLHTAQFLRELIRVGWNFCKCNESNWKPALRRSFPFENPQLGDPNCQRIAENPCAAATNSYTLFPAIICHTCHTCHSDAKHHNNTFTQANNSAVSSSSLFIFLPPLVLSPSSPFFASLSMPCSALALYLPAFFNRISLLTWFGLTNSLFS